MGSAVSAAFPTKSDFLFCPAEGEDAGLGVIGSDFNEKTGLGTTGAAAVLGMAGVAPFLVDSANFTPGLGVVGARVDLGVDGVTAVLEVVGARAGLGVDGTTAAFGAALFAEAACCCFCCTGFAPKVA